MWTNFIGDFRGIVYGEINLFLRTSIILIIEIIYFE